MIELNDKNLVYSAEAAAALRAAKPVVALESTIIAHGMPYPQNLAMARGVEQLIRDAGATPATIGILGGKLKIGLEAAELEFFARAENIAKVSRRDLAQTLAGGGNGATTVAGTLICASLAGIKVFVTGGIGGVHRGGEQSLDVSADLYELAQTPVAVVCAGAKAILDIGRTLEVLETLGVPVIGYRTNAFPAFYTRDSGCGVDYRLDTPQAVAGLMRSQWNLGLKGGMIIANPVPTDDAMNATTIQSAIDQASAEAASQDIAGKAVTPFLLSRIAALTGGASLRTNIALVRNNAQLGAEIAIAFAGNQRNTD